MGLWLICRRHTPTSKIGCSAPQRAGTIQLQNRKRQNGTPEKENTHQQLQAALVLSLNDVYDEMVRAIEITFGEPSREPRISGPR